MSVRFTYPKSHQREEVRPLYEKLKSEKPLLFRALKARTIAGRGRLWSEEPSEEEDMRARKQSMQLRQFIRDNADCDGATAVSYAVADIFGLLFDEVVDELGPPKSQAQLRADRRSDQKGQP